MDMEKVAIEAIRNKIAEQALLTISEPDRNALVTKGIADAIKDWSFKNAVEKAVSKRAEELAIEYLHSDEGTKLIRDTVTLAMANFTASLIPALHSAMIEALGGRDGGSYDTRPGIILKYMKVKS